MTVKLAYVNKPSTACYVTVVLYEDIHDPDYQILVVAVAGMSPCAIDRARAQRMSGLRKMARIAADRVASFDPTTQKIVSRNPVIGKAIEGLVIKPLAKA